MKGARLVVELERLDEPGPTGLESVALTLVSHPGAPALPLGKGASGGELSRIMLALEVVLADAAASAGASTHTRTLVFDEIDAGVGGRAAREIGRRLARWRDITRSSWSPTWPRWRPGPAPTSWCTRRQSPSPHPVPASQRRPKGM